MDRSEAERRCAEVQWYHDFDFPGGLAVRSNSPYAPDHRNLWAFIESELNELDFRGKSVLDVGCWDGYWSFYAERRGAGPVLATDDFTQNWAGSRGLLLARELLGSRVQTKLDQSIYKLGSLR